MTGSINVFKLRRSSIGILLVLIVSFVFLSSCLWYISGWYETRAIADQKVLVLRELTPYGQELTSQIDRRVAKLNAITAFSAANKNDPDFSKRFESFSAGLYYNVDGLIALEVAPDMIIEYIYPLKGNEKAMGLNLLTDSRKYVRDDTNKTIAIKKAAIFGPYDLVQGGKGFVAREPIFNNDGALWGLSTVVMEVNPIFTNAHIDRLRADLVAGVKDSSGNVLFGSKKAFSNDAVVYEITVPNGTWVLSAEPKSSWPALAAQQVSLVRIVGAIVVGLLMLLILMAAVYRQNLADTVRARTLDLEKMNRLYAVISKINEAIVRVEGERELYDSVCQILVTEGHFLLSWIGIVDETTMNIDPVAKYGQDNGYLEGISFSASDASQDYGLSGLAVRKKELIVCDDIEHDPSITLWRDLALAHGFKASAAVPINRRGQVIGAMMIYAGSAGFFSAETMSLLVELESTISFALGYIAEVADKKTAELAVREALDETENRVRERTADLVEANEKLKELDRLKSIFIATMSHELRTPLNSIIGFSSILLNEWVGPLSDEQKQNMATVVRSGKHLLALVNDIIDISKIEAGKVAISVSHFSLKEAVKEVVEMLARDADDRYLELKTSIEDMELVTDKRRFIQCVTNLVSNAIKFTETGEIIVTAGPIESGEKAEIRVKDTGIGISKKDLKQLFKAFERIETPGHDQPPGTGLGLYLSKRIIENILGGNITAESDSGKGSVFTMTVAKENREGFREE